MNDFQTERQRIRKELRVLARDLGSPRLAGPRDWREMVSAVHSFGRDIRVTRLDLAVEFLGVLCERDQLLKRVGLQRTIDPQDDPRDEEVESLARFLLEDDSLVSLIGARLHDEGAFRLRGALLKYTDDPSPEDGATEEAETLVDILLHESVEADRALLVAERIAGRNDVDPDLKQVIFRGAGVLQESMLNGLSSHGFKTLTRWLKAYRRSTLAYTWLFPSDDSRTPIHHLHTLMKTHEFDPYGWLRQLSNDPEYAELGDVAYGLWEELAGLFIQIDFDDIIEDLKGGIVPFGPAAGDRVNILPGDGKVACKPVLLAFARGGGSGSGKSGKFAFENVMKAVKQHVIDCQDVLKLVILVTDTWDSRKFVEDHFGELSSWRRRNVRFLFLGVGAPRNQLARIAVDLT